MFGFRSNHTRTNAHSNTQRAIKQGDVRPHADIKRVFAQQLGPSFDETIEDDRFYDNNNSVDMSLYTTQSKATVGYPSRLPNHNFDDDDMSCAPTEFTTEIAMNRYFRLGGDWRPSFPLNCTPPAKDAVPVTPGSFTPQTKTADKATPLTASMDSQSRDLNTSDVISLDVTPFIDSDCEETTCSLLPATAKMARFAPRTLPLIKQQARMRPGTPLVRKTSIVKVDSKEKGTLIQIEPDFATPSRRERLQSPTNPVDLDETVTDSSSSVASSSDSCMMSPSGLASSTAYQAASDHRPEQISLFPIQDARSRYWEKKDDGMCIVSVEDSSSAASSKLSLHYGTSTRSQKETGPTSVAMSLSSGSWRGQALQSPDAFSVDSSRDDDTFGFSISSTHKSSETEPSSSTARQLRRVALFKQWEDPFQSGASPLSKSGGKSRPRNQSTNDDASSEKLSSSSFVGNLYANGIIPRSTVSAVKRQASKFSPSTGKPISQSTEEKAEGNSSEQVCSSLSASKGDERSKESISNQPLTALWKNRVQALRTGDFKPTKSSDKAQRFTPSISKSMLRTDISLEPSTTKARSQSPLLEEKKTAKMAMQEQSQILPSSFVGVDRQAASDSTDRFPRPPSQTNLSHEEAWPERKIDLLAPSSLNFSEEHKPGQDDKQRVAKGFNESPRNMYTRDMDIHCRQSVISALTCPIIEPKDDDTFGFSTTSAIPVSRISDDDTLGFSSLPGPIIDDAHENDTWTAYQGGLEDEHDIDNARQNIRRQLVNQTYQETMNSTSFVRRSNYSRLALSSNSEDDDRDEALDQPKALLLTEFELRKHVTKVQAAQPLPSSSFEGYDSWKCRHEEKQRYFAKLEAKAIQQSHGHNLKRDLRQPRHSPRSNPSVDQRESAEQPSIMQKSRRVEGKCIDSTRSAMDHSMDSSIPTVDDARLLLKSRREKAKVGRRRRWGWFQWGKTKRSKDENSKQSATPWTEKRKRAKEQSKVVQQIVSLSQFMRISADEDLDEFSLLPLHKDGVMSLGTTTFQDCGDTVAATKSHYMDGINVGTRTLVSYFLEDEREKQRQAHIDRTINHEKENEQISKRRHHQCLNIYENWNSRQEGSGLMEKQKFPTTKSATELPVVVQSSSASSKHSVDSSMKSGSTQLLAPCYICNAAERTHIAMPCMHFYFCTQCVGTLYQKECPICPVCSTENVVFTRVYTG